MPWLPRSYGGDRFALAARARIVSPPRVARLRRFRRAAELRAERGPAWAPVRRAAVRRAATRRAVGVGARRFAMRRALTGGAVAIGALGAYGMYRGIRRLRRRRTARRTHRTQRRHVGVRVGTSRTKEILTQNVHEAVHQSYVLHNHEITTIGALDKTNNHRRQRNDINLRGFRLNLRISHQQPYPGVLTVMLVSLKHGANLSAVNNDFFKTRNGDEISFPQGVDTLNGSDYVDLGYNKEIMNVLWYKRFQMSPRPVNSTVSQANNTYVQLNGKNYFQVNEYVKMNRQINFDKDDHISPEAPHSVYMLHWYANPFASSNTPVSNCYTMTRKVSAIWRELTH